MDTVIILMMIEMMRKVLVLLLLVKKKKRRKEESKEGGEERNKQLQNNKPRSNRNYPITSAQPCDRRTSWKLTSVARRVRRRSRPEGRSTAPVLQCRPHFTSDLCPCSLLSFSLLLAL